MFSEQTMSTSMIRVTVHFSGHVQGVGFRYRTVRIAEQYVLAGYVENLSDGRVRLVAEGESVDVEKFLVALTEQMSRFIRHQDRNQTDASGEFGPPDRGAVGIRY